MEKHELLSILYSERQRLAAKYTSPGWNYWVLLGALVSSILYFLDLDPINKFVWENVLSAIWFLIFCFVIPIYSFMLFVKKKKEFKESKLTDVSKLSKKHMNILVLVCSIILLCLFVCIGISKVDIYSFNYSIITLLACGLIYIICIYGSIQTCFHKLRFGYIFGSLLFVSILSTLKILFSFYAENWTGTEFKFAVIMIVATTIIICLFNLSKNDLSSIDKLIDNTINTDYVDADSTLKLLSIITIDYSIKSIYKDKINYAISKKYFIEGLLKEIDKLFKELQKVNFLSPEANEIKANYTNKIIEIQNVIVEIKDIFSALVPSITDAHSYIGNDNSKLKQLSIVAIELTDIYKYISDLTDSVLSKIDRMQELLDICSNCEHNIANCKDKCSSNKETY